MGCESGVDGGVCVLHDDGDCTWLLHDVVIYYTIMNVLLIKHNTKHTHLHPTPPQGRHACQCHA